MTWTTPRTWADEELVTANLMNTHIRDNLNALKAPPAEEYERTSGSSYSTTATSFGTIDNTNMNLSITTAGGDVLVLFTGVVSNTDSLKTVNIDIEVDGTRVGGSTSGIVRALGTNYTNISFAWLVTGLSAGNHTFKAMWKVTGGTGYLQSESTQFAVREV